MLDASITAIGGNVLWLDAADQNTLIDNDGDSVFSGSFNGQIAQWNDKSGNGNNLSHAAGFRQPTYTAAGQNGNDTVSFDGDDALYITDALQSGLDLNGNGMTLIAVLNPASNAGSRIIINKESSYEVAFNSGNLRTAISTTAPGGWAWGGNTNVPNNIWNITGFEHDNTVWNFYQDSALTQQMTPANNQTGNITPSNNIFTVGGRGGSSPTGSFFHGDMAEIILFDRALTNNERLDIEIYLSNKWDITLNNAAPTITKSSGDVAQGATITISTDTLSSNDPDGANTDLVYTLSSLATNGTLKLNGIDLNTSDTFTQQQIIDGDLTFTHDGSATAGSFDFTVADKVNTTAVASFSFNLSLSETTNNTVTLNEGGSITLSTADLEFGPPPDAWYDTDWLYRQRITIDSANIGANLTDFTVLLTGDNMNAGFWTDVKANGSDILLTSADGVTKLARELVSIDTVLETMELHVKLPTIDSGSDTNFYLYFGNAAGAEGNDTATWNADYAGVWHLGETAGNAIDATGNGNNGSMQNGVVQGVAGVIGKAVALDGINDYINASLTKGATTSFSFWATWDGGANDMLLLAGNYGSGPDLFFVPGADKISWNTWDSSNNAFGSIPASASDGDFHHYKIVIEPAGSKLYYDGVLLGTAAYKDPSSTNVFQIGGGNPSYTWGGDIDEVRVSNTAISADWITAEYANQKTPSLFYSVSTIQTSATSLTYTLTDVADNGILKRSGVALVVTDNFIQSDIDNGLITYEHNDSNTLSDFFSFTVSNGLGDITNIRDFNFSITPLNDDGGGHITPEDNTYTNQTSQEIKTTKNNSEDSQTPELIRSTFSGDTQSAFYGNNMFEIVREGTTMQIHRTLDEMNGGKSDKDHSASSSLPDGTPQITNVFGENTSTTKDHAIWQFLEIVEETEETLEDDVPLPEQLEGAILLEQNKFSLNVLGFLDSIGGQA